MKKTASPQAFAAATAFLFAVFIAAAMTTGADSVRAAAMAGPEPAEIGAGR